MSKPNIPIFVSFLQQAVERLRERGDRETSTEKIITEAYLEYTVDRNIPVNRSWNARVGRTLKANAAELGLFEQRKKQRFRAADGRRSCCSVWGIIS